MAPVEVRGEAAQARSYVAGVRADALQLLGVCDLAGAELSLVLVDDAAMQVLNREYRGKDRPTDVLSFPQFAAGAVPIGARRARRSAPPIALGDVIISLDTACRQAAASGIKPPDRIRALLIHGLLHLLGFDHERSAADARRMFARERELLALLVAKKPRAVRRPIRTRKLVH
ncbi:MAG: rRNA maturation RNase YbeY [Candidatus Binataceae bacterium]|nr:rRNA maturation RNase YbeY [Candidatus Binataceae bacterium]